MFPSNVDPEDAHLHATLKRIDELANKDVEMRGPLSEELTLLVLDTNILLHHFEMLEQFIADVESLSLPLMVIIPGVVIYELDGQKNRGGLAWFARRASQWLLYRVKERKIVRGQANEETCKPSGNWKVRGPEESFSSERANDFLIYDCCQYFQSHQQKRTFLCSADKNLCTECEIAAIPAINVTPRFSSRDVAQALFGHDVDLGKFCGYHSSYKNSTTTISQRRPVTARVAADGADDDDDGMDIDEDDSSSNVMHPSHALDLLHIQVVDHFTRLLIELVWRVGGLEVQWGKSGASLSRYAPSWSQKSYLQYTASDCLEFLESKRCMERTSPRLDVFLSKPYACPGARRGQDWSRKDWDVGLTALGKVGDIWDEESIRESLRGLEMHLGFVFAQAMRPTGL